MLASLRLETYRLDVTQSITRDALIISDHFVRRAVGIIEQGTSDETSPVSQWRIGEAGSTDNEVVSSGEEQHYVRVRVCVCV